ncbi:glycosyltransferase family 4 protein [bacterium]|nr:glycosyltransferase family 4 protein [bacterium]
MKIAYLNSVFPKLTATFIYREVLELRRRNIRIKIYAIHPPNLKELSKEALSLCEGTFYLLPISYSTLLKCHSIFLIRSPLKYFYTLFKMLTGTFNRNRDRIRSLMHFGEGVVLAHRMLKDGITHVHAHYASHPASVARVFHLLTDKPYSFTAHAHDIWNDQLLLPEKLEEATFAICCTKVGKKRLIRQAKEDVSKKVYVVYHGLDVRKFIPPKSDARREKNLILSIGSLGPTKGFPDLIKACAIIRDRNITLQCIIIGEGNLRSELEALVCVYDLKEQVKLIGALPQERLTVFFHKASVFVLPCVTTSDDNHDGLPNVLMEAMATGLPVITTSNTAQVELIENEKHGLLVTQQSPIEIANAIERLFKDNVLWKSLQLHGRSRVENDFNSHKTIKPLISIFDKYIG